MNSNIDFLIVGAGLYGATCARLLTDAGFNCFIIEKRNHIAGNAYTQTMWQSYDKHVYGPHIFHTNDIDVESFIKKYSEWLPYIQNTIAIDKDKLYHLPFNMNTFYDVFGITSSMEAKQIIDDEINKYGVENPSNLEEQAINLVGKTIFEKLIKNYTEKQWGCSCKELSPEIITRLPLRFSFNNNYFNDSFQGIPKYGYTELVKNIIGNIPCLCDIEFNKETYEYWKNHVNYKIIYCGAVDELLCYQMGELKWRSLKFVDTEYTYNGYNGHGTAVINNVSSDNKYTRSIEHMWFTPNVIHKGICSIITTEFPDNWERGKERYYSINNKETEKLYQKYVDMLKRQMPKIMLGGRLGKYKYFDMDDTIKEAMQDVDYFIQKYKYDYE